MRYILTITIVLLSLLLGVSSCNSGGDTPLKLTSDELLVEVDANLKEVKSVGYNLDFKFEDLAKNKFYQTTLNAKIARNSSDSEVGAKFRYSFDDGNQMSYDGETFRLLEADKSNVIIVDNENGAANFIFSNTLNGSFNFFMSPVDSVYQKFLIESDSAWVAEDNENIRRFVFKKYMQADDILVYGDWTIDKKLKVPIKYIEQNIMAGDTSRVTLNFSNMVLNQDYDASLFTAETPEGFAENYFKLDDMVQPTLAQGAFAPEWSLKDNKGKSFSLAQYKGKPVLIDFWGTWCVWCVRSFPQLKSLYETYNSAGVQFVGISCQEPPNADPQAFAKDKGIDYTILLNGDNVAQDYKVQGFPTLYVLDKEGRVAYIHSGFDENLEETLGGLFQQLLAQ